MNRKIYGLLASLLLLGPAVGCAQAPAPEATATPAASATPEAGASPDAMTASQSEQPPIAGWKKLEGTGVELWLPDSYQGGDLNTDLNTIVAKLKALGPSFEATARQIEQNPSAFALWAFDSKTSQTGFLTNVNITVSRGLTAVSLEKYLEATAKQLPSAFKIQQSSVTSLDQGQAGRIVTEFELQGVRGKQLFYAVKQGDAFWTVVYSASVDDFDQLLPDFEKSARTLKIQG